MSVSNNSVKSFIRLVTITRKIFYNTTNLRYIIDLSSEVFIGTDFQFLTSVSELTNKGSNMMRPAYQMLNKS